MRDPPPESSWHCRALRPHGHSPSNGKQIYHLCLPIYLMASQWWKPAQNPFFETLSWWNLANSLFFETFSWLLALPTAIFLKARSLDGHKRNQICQSTSELWISCLMTISPFAFLPDRTSAFGIPAIGHSVFHMRMPQNQKMPHTRIESY